MRRLYSCITVVTVSLLVIALAIAGVLYWLHRRSRARTELLVTKVLRDPAYAFRGDEEDEFYDYLDTGTIPYTKQVALVNAAFRRIKKDGFRSEAMLRTLVARWSRDGSFAVLPFAVNEAIFASRYKQKQEIRDICVGRILCNVASTGGLDSYLDIEFIMLSIDDDDIILYTCSTCHPDTLFAHRPACLTMLKRKDIGHLPKIILLGRIADFQHGKKWFEGEDAVLECLESLKDERIQTYVHRIREQIKGNLEYRR